MTQTHVSAVKAVWGTTTANASSVPSLLNRGNSSTAFMKTWLAERPCGRVLLHVACLLRDGHVRWHWAGVLRELRLITF